MKSTPFIIPFTLLGLMLLSGCASVRPRGDTIEEKRAYVEESMSELMDAFVLRDPTLPDKIDGSVGYAIFRYRASKLPIWLSGIGGGHGFGMARDMQSGHPTYMKLQKAQWGFGMGTRDLGVLFVFSDRAVFEKFIAGKWDAAGGVEATAKGGSHGGAMEGSASVRSGFGLPGNGVRALLRSHLADPALQPGQKPQLMDLTCRLQDPPENVCIPSRYRIWTLML